MDKKIIAQEIKVDKFMKMYKFIATFILPVILLIIVGSVTTRNKPLSMKSTLLASGLANLVIIGFITNTFITLGIDYIKFKNENDWSRGHKKEIYMIIVKNILLGIFNFFYLFLWTFILADLCHWLSPAFFLQNHDFTYPIDWGGVVLSCVLAILLSIFMALLLAQYIRKYIIFGAIGLLYFLAFGYLAGGMFGPGATYWMSFAGLLLPHAYIAHFFAGALTGGHYTVAHMPRIWDILTLGNTSETNHVLTNEDLNNVVRLFFGGSNGIEKLSDEQIRAVYVSQNCSIWDLSTFQMNQWTTKTLTIAEITIFGHTFSDTVTYNNIYNSFYQVSALNIFVPMAIIIGCGATWFYKFYNIHEAIHNKK